MKLAKRCKRCDLKIPSKTLHGLSVIVEDTPATRQFGFYFTAEGVCECQGTTGSRGQVNESACTPGVPPSHRKTP